MAPSVPLNYLTGTETAALVQSGTVTVEDIARAHIERYKQRNADVEAWAYIDEERILREAAWLDAVPEASRGPLHGLVLGVKDMIRTSLQDLRIEDGPKLRERDGRHAHATWVRDLHRTRAQGGRWYRGHPQDGRRSGVWQDGEYSHYSQLDPGQLMVYGLYCCEADADR